MLVSLAFIILACGRPATPSDVKLVGVGGAPDEIGPAPESAGGYIEYDYVNFAGGGLSLAAVGLGSFEEAGPGFVGFAPPYEMIYGLAFVFDEKVPAPDAHHGSIGIPPTVEDSCWTNTEPLSYLMASTVELGSEMVFASEDQSVYYRLGRVPELYPPDPRDVFVYYSAVERYLPDGVMHYTGDGSGTFTDEVLRPANFQHGKAVRLSFLGGLPAENAPVSAIPLPSSSVDGVNEIVLPSRTSNLHVEWNGPRYDYRGRLVDEGYYVTCVQYLSEVLGGEVYAAMSQADRDSLCGEPPAPPEDTDEWGGQIYTGPWDMGDDGEVTFRWTPGTNEGEVVSLSIRFLGPVDVESESFLVGKVPASPSKTVTKEWGNAAEDGLVEGEVPEVGYLDPLACDDASNIDWMFDPALKSGGEYNTALRGDPTFNLVEVSCRLADDGEFVLNNDHLETALAYAARKGAEGAMFYFVRSTELDATFPAVKDQAGNRVYINPVKVRAQSVDIGRFWVDPADDLGAL